MEEQLWEAFADEPAESAVTANQRRPHSRAVDAASMELPKPFKAEDDEEPTTKIEQASSELNSLRAANNVVSLGWAALCKTDAQKRIGNMKAMKGLRAKRPYDNRLRALRAKPKAHTRRHAENRTDPLRIKRVLRKCRCRSGCFSKLTEKEATRFLQHYWAWGPAEQDSFILMSADHPMTSNQERCTWKFLGESISVRCLPYLLGSGQKELYKALNVVPDMRSASARPAHPSEKHALINAFLFTTYYSPAETLPDNFIRRGHRVRPTVRLDDTESDSDGDAELPGHGRPSPS